MEYGYNNASPLLRGKYELTLENLKTYTIGQFEGNLEVQKIGFGFGMTSYFNWFNNKELEEVSEEYKRFVLDFDKTKGLIKGTRGNGEIQIAGKKNRN
jgi:hypothetical protein